MDWPVCKLQVCNLVFNKFAQAEQKKVNKHPKFDANFDIQCQLGHFKFDMNRTLEQRPKKAEPGDQSPHNLT